MNKNKQGCLACVTCGQLIKEPVAWMDKNKKAVYYHEQGINFYIEDAIPLYTHPAPSWQGLSDDEMVKIAEENMFNYYIDTKFYARAIEQALRTKNDS